MQDAEQDLATNTSKDPHPTDLQREYVFESRKATDRQRRRITSVAMIGVIVLAALAAFGFYQAKLARDQAQIALARQLVAQAQSINSTRNSKQNVAVLLGIQSIKLLPSSDATNLLVNSHFSVKPTRLLKSNAALNSVTFSPDGKYIAGASNCPEDNLGGNCIGSVFIWEMASGKKVAQLTHDGSVKLVVFSPKGKYLLSGSSDTTARLWEVPSGKEVFTIAHESFVNTVTFSPDGRYTLSGDGGGSIRIWDIANKDEIFQATLDGELPSVDSAAFSPDSKRVVTAGTCDEFNTLGICSKALIRVWDVASGKTVANMTHDGAVEHVLFSPDGRYVLSGGWDKNARLWDIFREKEVARFNYDNAVRRVAISPDGKYVLLGSLDNTARVWEITSENEIARMVHDGPVNSVDFSPDGKFALSGSQDGTARVWDATSGEEITRITHDEGSVSSVAFSPDGKYAISGGEDKTVYVWETDRVKSFARMYQHQSGIALNLSSNGESVFSRRDDDGFCVWNASSGKQVNCMNHYPAPYSYASSFDGKYMAWAGSDGVLRVWHAPSGEEVLLKRQNHHAYYVAFSPNERYILSASADEVCIWNAAGGNPITCMKHVSSGNSLGLVTSVVFSPDSMHAISISLDNTACVWELPNGKQGNCVAQDGGINSAALSPDNQYLLTAGNDRASVWEVTSGDELFHMNESYSKSVTFSPDGKYILAISDRTACVYEVANRKKIRCVNHDDILSSAIFSPDGNYVVSAAWDGMVRVWEIASGQEVVRKIHDSPVTSIAFSLNGKRVVSGSLDSTVRIWIWQLDELVADACSRLTRNLTRAEWNQFIGDAMRYPATQEEAACPELPIEDK